MSTPTWIAVSGFVFLFATALAQPATSDLKVTTRHTSSRDSFTTIEYYSGENSRSEMRYSSGSVLGHHRAIIRQRGTEKIQVYDLDLDAHEFVSYQTNLLGTTPGVKPLNAKASGKTFTINVDTVDTGERKEMFGQTARHLITRQKRIGGPENCYGGDSESEVDGWYIDSNALPAWRRPQATVVTALVGSTRHQGAERCYDKIEAHRTGPIPGYPVKTKTTNISSSPSYVSEMEVVEFSQAPLDPALFRVPADFKKVDQIVDPTQRQLQLQAMTYWQRFKEEVYNLFH